MQLIGVSNSPYFRRTAISLDVLQIPFEVIELSPFIHVEELGALNPVMKIPTLICDNGEQIMDSSLIIQFAEIQLSKGKQLWSDSPALLQVDFKIVGLAMAALEKCLQIVYETRLRPKNTQHPPWLARIQSQRDAALLALEQAITSHRERLIHTPCQASISSAVAWSFAFQTTPDGLAPNQFPGLVDLSEHMESLAVFNKFSPKT